MPSAQHTVQGNFSVKSDQAKRKTYRYWRQEVSQWIDPARPACGKSSVDLPHICAWDFQVAFFCPAPQDDGQVRPHDHPIEQPKEQPVQTDSGQKHRERLLQDDETDR